MHNMYINNEFLHRKLFVNVFVVQNKLCKMHGTYIKMPLIEWMNVSWVRALPGPMHLGHKTGPLCLMFCTKLEEPCSFSNVPDDPNNLFPDILRVQKKEPRYACMSEAKASHSHKIWTEVSSSVPHFLQVGLLLSPIIYTCLLKVLCQVSRPITTLDCVLLKDNNRAFVARSGPDINSRACLCVLQGPLKMPLIVMSTKILK
jgi:hypothetical protein